MKSLNLLEVGYYCISIMLYKGKSSPSPGLKIYLYIKKQACIPKIKSVNLLEVEY